ncbi:MAG TPA: magnesium transporter CorA family protein [Polyangiaceae bacterium]|jgi:magnesium transporter|nr:magnesium transporter CorA family protein [Polyangiaceae bacterium]
MLYVFSPEKRDLEPISTPPKSGWVHVVNPGPDEAARLHKDLGVPREHLRHALDLDEVARIDRNKDTRLIVLRVPWRQGEGQGLPYRAAPLGVMLVDGPLVTVTPVETEVIRDLLALPALEPANHHRFLFQLILCTADRFLSALREIDRDVATLEDELQASLRNEELLGLLKYQKSLVHITSALTSNRIMLERIQKDPRFQISPEDHDLLEDALVEIHQLIEMASISENVLIQMMDAFASLIANKLNSVMKVMTALAMILVFPTMVSSFFGMNVRLPFQEHPQAFLFAILLSVLISGAVAAIFLRKRWL